MSMSRTRARLCVLPLLAACGAGNADGERTAGGGTAAPAGSVSVERYCKQFAEAYLASNAIAYTGLSVRTEKKPDLMSATDSLRDRRLDRPSPGSASSRLDRWGR